MVMYREKICECCGQKVLVPYAPEEYRTPYERMDFEREWDRRVASALP